MSKPTDYYMERAIRDIWSNYKHKVSIFEKHKTLTKFGRNIGLGATEETVWIRGGKKPTKPITQLTLLCLPTQGTPNRL